MLRAKYQSPGPSTLEFV